MKDFLFWFLVTLGVLELSLRAFQQVRYRRHRARRPARLVPKCLSFESHPYALYVKKPGSDGLYPSNNLGYAGKQDVSKERKPGSVRLYCVGGSTTEAFDPARGPASSWPALLQGILAARFPGRLIECINAGTASYTSAESLSEFMFRGLDLKPDIVLVYHNVNDAWTCQMVDGFKSDYSHARRHKSWTVGWVNRLPQIPWLSTYQLVREWVMRRFGKANALLYWISDPPWKTVRAFDPAIAAVFERNITNLVSVALTWGCAPVLIKWECDWSAKSLPKYLERQANTTDVYFQFLEANNRTLERVASRFPGCHYLEVGPFEPEYFLDTMHFTGKGLDEMARRVADGIEPLVKAVINAQSVNRGDRRGLIDGVIGGRNVHEHAAENA